jgi:hypothetical protein
VGVLSNRYLLGAIAVALAFAAALIYTPALNSIFGTAPLTGTQLATVAPFPFIIWGADELRRLLLRRHRARHGTGDPHQTLSSQRSPSRNTAGERSCSHTAPPRQRKAPPRAHTRGTFFPPKPGGPEPRTYVPGARGVVRVNLTVNGVTATTGGCVEP